MWPFKDLTGMPKIQAKYDKPMTRFRLISLIIILLFNLAFYFLQVEYRYRYLVIHHTASSTDNYQSINEYHRKKRHWGEAAYHLILSNGSTEVPPGYMESTKRYKLLLWSTATRSFIHNLFGIHLVIVGNYEQQRLPENLQKGLVSAVIKLKDKFHIRASNIILHRDCNSTACPGKYITRAKIKYWVHRWEDKISEEIHLQHSNVLQNTRYHWANIKRIIPIWYGLNILLILGILLGRRLLR